MKKRTKKYFAPQNEDAARICDHPGCVKKGEYRAPKDRRLKDYYWFCLEHVQEYNAKWNYYEEDVEEEVKMHFRRPHANVKYSFMNGFDFFDDYGVDFSVIYTKEEIKYFEIMEIKPADATLALIKKQYKKLVKKYHPDINRADSQAEEKFKQLGVAYKYLLLKFS